MEPKLIFTHETLGPFVNEGEAWHIYDASDALDPVMKEHFAKIFQMALFTLQAEYIVNTCIYSDRFTLVYDVTVSPPVLVGFAALNCELFELSEAVSLWDGKSHLSASYYRYNRRTVKRPTPVVHLSVIVSEKPKLGPRLLEFQKVLALGFNQQSKLLALDAIKLLDILFYGRHEFQTTTQAFYPTSYKDTVPMFFKLDALEILNKFLGLPQLKESFDKLQNGLRKTRAVTMTSEQRISFRVSDPGRDPLWPTNHHDHYLYEDSPILCDLVFDFLWTKRTHEQAVTRLKTIMRRGSLSERQGQRLWVMRRYTSAYDINAKPRLFQEHLIEKYPQEVDLRTTHESLFSFDDHKTYKLRSMMHSFTMKLHE